MISELEFFPFINSIKFAISEVGHTSITCESTRVGNRVVTANHHFPHVLNENVIPLKAQPSQYRHRVNASLLLEKYGPGYNQTCSL